MSDELITPANVSLEQVQAILDAAGCKVSRDDASSMLRVDGENNTLVLLVESRQHLRFLAVFGLPADLAAAARVALANRVNDRLVAIRAAASSVNGERLCLDYYLCLNGGVGRTCIVLAFQHFETLVAAAVEEVQAGLAEESARSQAALAQPLRSPSPASRATADRAMLSSATELPQRFRAR